MTRFTVVWHDLAQDDLADIWLKSVDREAVTDATDAIDRQLTHDPQMQGTKVSERSRQLTVTPLQVLFRVSPSDRLVQIFSVTRVDEVNR